MSDLLTELLADANPNGTLKTRAEAAQILYQRAADVAGRVGLPLSSLRVELWPKKGSRRCLHALVNCLSYDGEQWRMQAAFPPVKGVPSYGAFGKAFALIEEKPNRVQSKKQPERDLWKVPLWRWAESPVTVYEIKKGIAQKEPHFLAEYVLLPRTEARYYDPDCGNHFFPEEAKEFPSVILKARDSYLVRCTRCDGFLNRFHQGIKQL